jgi:dTDP-4-dehydrorhamnose reductase
MGRKQLKILITGGNGYVAKSIQSALGTKYDITTITRQDFDLTNYHATCKFLENKYFDAVIHTAVVGGSRLKEDDDSVIKQNLDMYYNLINNKEHFGKFITFGSGAELGWPTTPYGYSKRIIAESMLKKDYCLNLRIFAVFDENELDRRFIKSNILRYINREDIVVHQNKLMDFFYMKDLITLVDHHLQVDEWLYNVIDCRYTESRTLVEIAEIINTLDKYRVNISILEDGGKPYTGNYVGLQIPLIGLENGIRNMYNNLR